MKNLLGRIKKAKALEACDLAVMPTSSFEARSFTSRGQPVVWKMVGGCSMGVVAVYVLDAVVLTLAREVIEGRTRPLQVRGYWMDRDPTDPTLGFYAVKIERPIRITKRRPLD